MAQARNIGRRTTTITATITSAADGLSDEFDFSQYAGGVLHMCTAWTEADIGFDVAHGPHIAFGEGDAERDRLATWSWQSGSARRFDA